MAGLHEARRPTDESKQYQRDERNRAKHIKGAARGFRALVKQLKPLADQAVAEFPDRDRLSLQRRGRFFNKHVKTNPDMLAYLDQWIGSTDQHPKAYSWRGTVIYQARDVLLYKKTLREAVSEVEKQAFKGFEAITMAEAQAPLRETVPAELREYLPQNIVVEVDEGGSIKRVTDRFGNEHLTLGKKIDKMRSLIRRYNAIAKQVKKDLKSRDEITKLAALITAIIMETGIRPGKMGNGKVKTVNGEDVFIETFGAITLGPAHVRFVRDNFARLEFVGKMTSVNTAEISDAAIIKVLNEYVQKALNQGSKFVFVTADGTQFTYTDLQRYFREHFEGISPTDFRKLKATETVLAALRAEQADLYVRIREAAQDAKADLRERVVAAIVDTFEAAIAKSQEALSHDSAATTIRAYINPEILLRFLSNARVDQDLQTAILSGDSTLSFDPQTFLRAAGVRLGSRRYATTLGDLLLELREDLEEAGVRKMAMATVRLADDWVKSAAGTEQDITDNLRPVALAYREMVAAIQFQQDRGYSGTDYSTLHRTNGPWVQMMNHGFKLAEGILGVRAIPPRQAKGLEMAYRLCYRSRRMPKDIYKWWKTNEKRILLLLEAGQNWPAREEGGDDLFKVGSFTVHNTVGARGAQLEAFKKMLEVAIKQVKTNPVPGFTRVLYGDIYLVGQITHAHHAAWYNLREDAVYCRVTRKKWGFDEAHSLVHELAHRYWRKFADKSAKAQWESHHMRVKFKKVDVPMPEVGDEIPVRVKGAPRGWRPTVESTTGGSYWYRVPNDDRLHSIPQMRLRRFLDQTEGAELRFPTAYSATSEEEHFCEATALVSARSLTDEHKIPFKTIWS